MSEGRYRVLSDMDAEIVTMIAAQEKAGWITITPDGRIELTDLGRELVQNGDEDIALFEQALRNVGVEDDE